MSQPTRPAGPQPLLRASRPPCATLGLDFLRFSLRTGERSRQDLMRAAARLGLTPKMIRVARERLGAVVVERRGFGPDGRTYWRLPSSQPSGAVSGAQGTTGQESTT